MTSKTRIQNYLRENKISELFEEMMGKLVRDLPASPVYYLVTFLQEKEKKIKQIMRETTAPSKAKKSEISVNAKLWASMPSPTKKDLSIVEKTASSPSKDGRKYDKPWLTHSKKSPNKPKSGSKLSQSASLDAFVTGNQNTKEDVVDGNAEVDLGLVYATPKIVGESHSKVRTPEEDMAAELSIAKGHEEFHQSNETTVVSSKISAKEAKRRRQEELRRLADDAHLKSNEREQSLIPSDGDSEDEALEVLESANELMNEGVKNPPKTGVIVGRSTSKEKEQIELVLNMSKFFDELGGMEGIKQNQTNGTDVNSRLVDDDDDFESASQVTGPRRPVWEAPKSEVESVASQLRSARISGIGMDSFVAKPESVTKHEKEHSSTSKPRKTKSKTSDQRPHTAPSKSRSNVELNGSKSPESPPKTAKTPRSRPTTPRGSQVGSGRASRRMSQASNISESRKEKERSKKPE